MSVREDFVADDDEYGRLLFADDDDVLDVQVGIIDPSKIVPHDWKKLRKIWKQLNPDYKGALTRFTLSGTHDSSFFSFCIGKLDVYYLRKNLEIWPNLAGFVEAALPDEVMMASDTPTVASINTSEKSDKKRRARYDIADAICEFTRSGMKSELASKKLHYMEREDLRKETQCG